MPTSREIKHLLPQILNGICIKLDENPTQISSVWKEIVGDKIARFTKVIEFNEGALKVKVDNSTLYSLLVQGDKEAILRKLRDQVPHAKITGLYFRIG